MSGIIVYVRSARCIVEARMVSGELCFQQNCPIHGDSAALPVTRFSGASERTNPVDHHGQRCFWYSLGYGVGQPL